MNRVTWLIMFSIAQVSAILVVVIVMYRSQIAAALSNVKDISGWLILLVVSVWLVLDRFNIYFRKVQP